MEDLKCTLTNEELIAKAMELTNKLRNTGRLTMQLPANPNEDYDFVFKELCERFQKSIIGNSVAPTRFDAVKYLSDEATDLLVDEQKESDEKESINKILSALRVARRRNRL